MRQHTALALLLSGVVAFAAYQAIQLVRSEPAPPPATPAPAAQPAPATPPRPVAPTPGLIAEGAPVGADAPFDVSVARRVTAAEVKAMVDGGRRVRIVDTRSSADGPIIAGAEMVPEAEIEAWARSVPKSATVVVYCACARESTAEREVLTLQRLGFRRAYALLDGLLAWEAAGLPTEQAPRR